MPTIANPLSLVDVTTNPPSYRHRLECGVELLPFRVEIRRVWVEPGRLHIQAELADRANGRPLSVPFIIHDYRLFGHISGEEHRKVIKESLLLFLAHELDELLLLDGERRDPHANDGVSISTRVNQTST